MTAETVRTERRHKLLTWSFDPPTEAEPMTMAELTTMTEHNDVVVQDGRLLFGAEKAEGPTAGQQKWMHLVLGLQGSAAEKWRRTSRTG